MSFNIPDQRSTAKEDYEKNNKLGQLKRSWEKGVNRQTDGNQTISFNYGLTWGSIGQILGYLLGDVDEATIEDLYTKMVEQYKNTDRGQTIE